MRLGFENRRQLYLLIVLCTGILGLAVWELFGEAGTSAGPHSAAAARSRVAVRRDANAADDLSNSEFEAHLRISELARSEQVEYASTGRNIFAFAVEAPHIESPAAPPRPANTIAAAAPPPAPPKTPVIDLKYLGYMQDRHDRLSAVLMHGGNSLTATTGDVVFHRYEVGVIHPGSVAITDLFNANTQSIGRSEK